MDERQGGEPRAALRLVSFRARGHRCAVEARFVTSLSAFREGPGAVDGGEFFGIDRPEPDIEGPKALLALDAEIGGPEAIVVGMPVDMFAIEDGGVHRLPPLVSARCAIRALRALTFRDGELVLLLDPRFPH